MHDHAGRPELQLEQYALHNCSVVAAKGDVDVDSLPPLRQAMEEAAAAHPAVVLDASGVTFVDSSALNLLLHFHRSTTLRIVAPSPQLVRLLKITGADKVVHISPTLTRACSAAAS
ncbi:anti-anti-sigma factor [Streptomyces sp. V3I8]|uniref:STAS domain-containing protein n=1 Tax=Streptomyces sp. V3I8 TaxID=3042279 RepID=UPI0027896D3C|nr:STAS domain-containing protein [Streptomyces sp. V3I8]MDQ1041697.1 anti-anti-sigma factor [Streptomyces sp. V3I8]